MGIKEVLVETGEKIIGHGPQVEFRHRIDEHAKKHGVPRNQAEKQIFSDCLNNVEMQAGAGRFDHEGDDWELMEGGIRESFDGKEKKKFIEDTDDPTIFRPMASSPLKPKDISRAEGYYSGKFKGEKPNSRIIRETAESTKLINELTSRLSADLGPMVASGADLKSILTTSNPEIGADIGKLLQAKESLQKHEEGFQAELDFKEAKAKLGEQAHESLGRMFWSGPGEFLGKAIKAGFQADKKSFGDAVGAGLNWAVKDLGIGGGKLLLRGLETTGLGIRKELKKT